MPRRHARILFLIAAGLALTWPALRAQQPGQGKGDHEKDAPEHVKAKIEELKKLAEEKKWTFQIGHTKASNHDLSVLAGTRVPPNLDVPKVANQVNKIGKTWLDVDIKTRDAFAKKKPGVLPGLKIEARTQPKTYAQKSAFDWRALNKVTEVRDQRSCGSCWDFTALGAFECNWMIRNNETLDCAEQQILDCSNAGNCVGGWWMGAFDYLIKHGVCTEQAYIYNNAAGTCKNVTSPYKATSWAFVASDGAIPSVDAMKTALCEHGPLGVAVNATEAFQHYTGGVFNEYASGNINHGVLLVGWDDNKGKNGAWLIRNSWTTGWGEKGYMWIEYNCNKIGDHAAWVEASSIHYDLMTLLANDYKVKSGDIVTAPIYLLHPTDVKNMNWTLAYDPAVATSVDPKVVQGNLPLTLFEANPREVGLVRMGFAQNDTIENTGTVAVLKFRAAGAPGSRTPLNLGVTKINNPKGDALPIKLVHGSIEIVKDTKHIPHGSCTGMEQLGIEDARCALQMSVGNRAVELKMDMDNDNQVTSRDAAIILQQVLDQTRRGQ